MRRLSSTFAAALAVIALAAAPACSGSSASKTPAATTTTAARTAPPPLDTDPPAKPKIVALGDSLTAGLGVFQVEAYPALLQQQLDADGYTWEVVNAGESGDTSATALRRVDWLLDPNVKILIVAVGGNDALRGLSPQSTHDNVAAIIQKALAKNVVVVLAGMEAPPNLGADYTAAFHAVFPRLAKETGVTFLPFLLEGVAGKPELNQADGIHPTPEGHKIIAAMMYDTVKPLVDDIVNR